MGLLEPICAVGVYYNTRHVLVLMKTVSKINLSCATSLFDEAMLLFEYKVFLLENSLCRFSLLYFVSRASPWLLVLRNGPRIYDIHELYEL